MTELDIVPDTSELFKFLEDFHFNLITVSLQPQVPEGQKLPPMPENEWFTDKNRVRAIPRKTFFTPTFQEILIKAQYAGFAVYFLMNEGDGVPAEPDKGNLNCGRRTNISILKTLAIDTDEADATRLMEELKKISLIPHTIIETSPHRFHFYFFIEQLKAEGDNILQWKALQRKLASLVPGLDQSLADINQVLRLPSFYNLKKNPPHRIKIFRQSNHKRYNLKFLYDRLEAYHFNELKIELNGTNGTGSYNKFTFPERLQSLSEGNRRQSICSYIEHIMENVLPITATEQEFFVLIDAFIIKYLKSNDAHNFLEGGSRRKNIEQYFYDQRNRRILKKQQLESLAATKVFDHQKAVEDSRLPDSFYLTFPGDLGMLTREIKEYAPNLSLELCFAGALCISGALKVERFRFRGSWPIVNGLVIAGTGAGKSTLKGIIERALKEAGLCGKYPQLFGFQNTVQSLHTALYAAGGTGTTLIDESGDYLETITSKNAPGYARALKKYFKEATTGRDLGTWLHPGGSLSFNVPAIDGGMLSLWMLIQPDKFTASLDLADMSDGFLPRFFVFNGQSNIKLTASFDGEDGAKSFRPSTDLTVWMESLIPPHATDISLQETIERTKTEFLESNPKAKIEAIKFEERNAVYRTRSEARRMRNIEVSITDEAKSAVLSYLKERERAASTIMIENPNEPSLGIYIRMEEMLMRLLCNAVSLKSQKAIVDLPLAEAAIHFHRFQTDRFFSNELVEIAKGTGEREHEAVLDGLKRAFRKQGEPVSIKDITVAIKSSKRPRNVGQVVRELVARGDIWAQERFHLRFKDKKVTVYLPAPSENPLD